jgi:hypothetical protein
MLGELASHWPSTTEVPFSNPRHVQSRMGPLEESGVPSRGADLPCVSLNEVLRTWSILTMSVSIATTWELIRYVLPWLYLDEFSYLIRITTLCSGIIHFELL